MIDWRRDGPAWFEFEDLTGIRFGRREDMDPLTNTALAERERILAIIRTRILDTRLRMQDPYTGDPSAIQEIEALEDLLDDIAFKTGLTAADVRVPNGSTTRA